MIPLSCDVFHCMSSPLYLFECPLLSLFAGPIPDSFTCLTNLKELYLNDNRLTGTVPASLHRIRFFRCDNNSLST